MGKGAVRTGKPSGRGAKPGIACCGGPQRRGTTSEPARAREQRGGSSPPGSPSPPDSPPDSPRCEGGKLPACSRAPPAIALAAPQPPRATQEAPDRPAEPKQPEHGSVLGLILRAVAWLASMLSALASAVFHTPPRLRFGALGTVPAEDHDDHVEATATQDGADRGASATEEETGGSPARAAPEAPNQTAKDVDIEVRGDECRDVAIRRTMDALIPPPTSPNSSDNGWTYNGPQIFKVLTPEVEKVVFQQPWDRVVCAYLWRIHAGLQDDLRASLRPFPQKDAARGHVFLEYDFSLDLPAPIRVLTGHRYYRWVERIRVDIAGRRLWSFCKSPMFTDRFSSLEFIEFHAVNDRETYCRKGLICDSAGFPPKWALKWIAKAYGSRSRDTCEELNDKADSAEEVPGHDHPDSRLVWSQLGLPKAVSARTPAAPVAYVRDDL